MRSGNAPASEGVSCSILRRHTQRSLCRDLALRFMLARSMPVPRLVCALAVEAQRAMIESILVSFIADCLFCFFECDFWYTLSLYFSLLHFFSLH